MGGSRARLGGLHRVLICFIHCLNRGAVGQPTQGCGDLVWGLFGDLEGLGGDQGKGWICLIL